MGKVEFLQRLRQRRLTGGILPQAMFSFMPRASGPQAAVCASRTASGSELAEAVALFWVPANATVTEHSTRWEARVDQSRKAAKASSTSIVRFLPRAVMLPSLSACGLGATPQEPSALHHCSVPNRKRGETLPRGKVHGM